MGDDIVVSLDHVSRLENPDPQVAALLGKSTASSGEAIAVAFQNRSNTVSLGDETAGLASADQIYLLDDGAAILLPVAYFADRTGKIYHGPHPTR